MSSFRLIAVLLVFALAGCQTAPSAPSSPSERIPVVLAADTSGLDPVLAPRGMVSADHPEASRVGAEVLRAGGNAVDAAVATAFALAVTLPYAGNVGGGGFIVIRFPDGSATTIDFREVAPLAASRDMYIDEDGQVQGDLSWTGHLSVAVPGSPAGLLEALERYGTLDRAAVLDPAIALAENGFPLTRRQSARLNRYRSDFLAFPSSARYFVKPDTTDFFPEERLVQSDLAEVLRRIRDEGRDGFYRGRTADLIVAEMERGGGLITHEDLARYEPVEREPVVGTYRGHRVIAMPPPSSGGIAIIQLLHALEPVDFGAYGFQSAEAVHRMGEAMRRVYADRARWIGDPDFVEIPGEGLLDKSYMLNRMASFEPERASVSAEIQGGTPPGAPRTEPAETTHLSTVDADGMAVSLTTTVNGLFGSRVAVDGAGFLLNNIMNDFTVSPDRPNVWGDVTGDRNTIAPGKRMLSSMTPTIVEDPEGRVRLVVGTPGGPTIITTVYQVIVGVLDFGLPLQASVEAPRFHHQWDPDAMFYERGLPQATLDGLEAKGWSLRRRSGTSGSVAAIEIRYDGEARTVVGARDPRTDITPVGH